MSPSPSLITKSERWDKLYRSIHNLFLKDELVHVEDYRQMVKEMNLRITEVEANLQAELTKIQTGLGTHGHNALQAPPTIPPYTLAYKPSKEVIPLTVEMEKTDRKLMLQGPARAPLSLGISTDEQKANIEILKDIGI